MDQIAWTKQWRTGKRWFARLKAKKGSGEGTFKLYGYALYQFTQFKREQFPELSDPDKIFDDYKRRANEDLDDALDTIEFELDLFMNWLVETTGIERSTAGKKHAAIKSWLYNNAKSFTGIPTPETYSEEIPPVNMEELRELIQIMDARETFLTMFLKDSGISQKEALKINYGQIRKEFERGEQFIRIKVFRKKENVDYETFIGPNTVEALKIYLTMRKRSGEKINDNTPLFASSRKPFQRLSGAALREIYNRTSKKTGIKITSHRLRKFFETWMALGKVHPIILEYWMGHKVGRKGKGSELKGKYIIPPTNEQRKTYAQNYKYINVKPQRDAMEMLIAETKARTADMTPEQKQRFIKAIAFRRKDLNIMDHPEIKKILEEQPADGKLPAQPRFKEIEESELLLHLNSGWQIVHNLQNGRVIVKR